MYFSVQHILCDYKLNTTPEDNADRNSFWRLSLYFELLPFTDSISVSGTGRGCRQALSAITGDVFTRPQSGGQV